MAVVSLGLPTVPNPRQGGEAWARPDSSRLLDRFGRVATDLRVSLTDKCNLRCAYCMPPEGLPWLSNDRVLTDAEVGRLLGIAVQRLGVKKLRFTGGEPLLRRGLVEIVRAAARLDPRPELMLTTNAIGLEKVAAQLVEAGLDRVNVSLDTLDHATFRKLSHRDRLDGTLTGLAAAKAAGLSPVKINSVLLRGVNSGEVQELAEFALANGHELRFIEQMPLDAQHAWDRGEMLTAEEILANLRERWQLTPDPNHRGAAPAETWLVDGGPARIGVVAAVTRPFCGACDRTRLTADGQIRDCLFATGETDLRGALRGGATDEQIAELCGHVGQARRARHRRPLVPATGPADVGHRRLTPR
jgi:cyclic pyranopterin phosphate synthase